MCWLELSKGFITNNLFVKRILFSCSWNIHEQEHCFLKCIYLKCSSGSFKWITEGLACKWFLLFSCTWANKPPGIDCFARLLRQQHPSCANRVWGVSVCVNATAGLPQLLRGQPQPGLHTGTRTTEMRSLNSLQKGCERCWKAKPLKIQMSVRWAKDNVALCVTISGVTFMRCCVLFQ